VKRAAALALAGLLPLTSGCIAAVVPLAAGAALVKTRDGKGDPRTPDAASTSATSSAKSAEPSEVGEPGGDPRVTSTSLASLPPPGATSLGSQSEIAAFRSYALAQAGLLAGAGGKRISAILRDASQLRAVRAECGNLPPAVFVDLDPGRETFDPLEPGIADPALGAALAELRGRAVRIVWFSRLSSNFAEATRAALAASGLDPSGSDELVLMPDIDERKQSLRDQHAKRSCPIAMVGDERADFDELYLYLRNPALAIELDVLLGKGWFLASPFIATTAAQPGTVP
jgi:hypothetical protein